MTDMISRADAIADLASNGYIENAATDKQVSHNVGIDTAIARLRDLPAAQVAVKPLEWAEEKTLGVGCIRLVADSILGKFSIEYGGWANGKLCLGVPWRDESVWLENDPDAAKTHANRLLSDHIRSALIDTPAQVADPAQIRGAALLDPIAVHANMLRGTIAMPSVNNIIHLYGEDVLRAALIPTPPADAPELVALVDAATPGPWRLGLKWGSVVADGSTGYDDQDTIDAYGGHLVCESAKLGPNARFVAWCRDGVPGLLDAIAAQTARVEAAEARAADLTAKLEKAMAGIAELATHPEDDGSSMIGDFRDYYRDSCNYAAQLLAALNAGGAA